MMVYKQKDITYTDVGGYQVPGLYNISDSVHCNIDNHSGSYSNIGGPGDEGTSRTYRKGVLQIKY